MLPQTLAAVAVVVELIIPSDSLVADRDVLQQREREIDWKRRVRNRKGDNDGGRADNLFINIIGETSFSPQNALKGLAAGLGPNPLEKLSAPPNPQP